MKIRAARTSPERKTRKKQETIKTMHLEYIPASVPSIMCSLPREYRVHAKSGGEHEVQGSDTRNMKRVQDKKDTHEEGYEHIESKLEGSQQGECGNKEAKTEK